MARPTKPARDRQSKIVALRLTPAEARELAKIVKITGRKKSEVLRDAVKLGLDSVEIRRKS